MGGASAMVRDLVRTGILAGAFAALVRIGGEHTTMGRRSIDMRRPLVNLPVANLQSAMILYHRWSQQVRACESPLVSCC